MARDAWEGKGTEERIREAVERLVAGKPAHPEVRATRDQLTAAALAVEAKVGRATLYREPYRDILEEFEARVKLLREDSAPAHPVVELKKKLNDALEQIADLKSALKEQTALAEGLAQELKHTRVRWRDAERLLTDANRLLEENGIGERKIESLPGRRRKG